MLLCHPLGSAGLPHVMHGSAWLLPVVHESPGLQNKAGRRVDRALSIDTKPQPIANRDKAKPTPVTMSCDLPKRAAHQIALNPHSFRHVPPDLVNVVSYNRHQTALSAMAQAAYLQRRGHWDDMRLERIRRENLEKAQSTAVVSDDEETDNDPSELMSDNLNARARMRSNARRRTSIYEAPFALQLPEQPASPPQPTSPSGSPGRRSSMFFVSYHDIMNPEERMRLRCSTFKSHRPGLWPRRSSVGAEELHPSWHLRLRGEYRQLGYENQWKLERDAFLQDYRRNRLFNDLTRRRMSN